MKQPTIVIFSAAFVLGISLASWPLVGLLAVPFGYYLFRRNALLSTIAVVTGVVRVLLTPLAVLPSETVLAYNGPARVEGQPITTPDNQRLTLRLLSGTNEQLSHLALVDVAKDTTILAGDRVKLHGSLLAPNKFDQFDYPRYLSARGISYVSHRASVQVESRGSSIEAMLYKLKLNFRERIDVLFRYPASALINGVLLGDQSGITDSLGNTFQRTGTTHVLVVSGFNISILAAVVIAALGRRPGAIVLGILTIFTFVLLVGPSAAVIRAALMTAYLLIALTFGRPQTAITACSLTACVLLLTNPWLLRFDAGFCLSFAATLGVLLLAPWVSRWIRLRGVVGEAFSASLAATLATLPVSLIQFQQFSIVGPLANILIVPLVPLLMAAGLVALSLSYVVPVAAELLAVVISWMVLLPIRLLETIAGLPFALLIVPAWVGLCCILGFGIFINIYDHRHT